jgi:hypothetical protein
MRKAKARSSNKVQHLVPNNPEYDRRTRDPEEVAAEKKAIRDTLYDASSYRTYAGHWKQRDEPSEPKKTEYPRIDKKQFATDLDFWKRRNQQAAARERLKKKPGGVPARKDGRKLFDEFTKEAYSARPSQTKLRETGRRMDDLRNAYNASSTLSFDKWVIFMNDLFKGQI